MNRTQRIILLGLTIAVVGGGGLMAAARQSKTAKAASKPSLAVEAALARQENWPRTVAASGAIAPWQEDVVSAETGGLRIAALHADVGSKVRRGQLLAELSSDTVKADLQKAEAAVASARAVLREAHSNARRAREAAGALSAQQVEQSEIAAETAAAALASAEASLQAARIRLQQTRIVAMSSGVISARSAALGMVVPAGSDLFRLIRDERVEWRAELDATQLGLVRKGHKATINLADGESVSGTVRQLAPALDTKSRTGVVYVDLPTTAGVRAGAYVSGQIETGQAPATTVPGSAIVQRDGRSYLFEIDVAKNTVARREVITGRSRDGRVEIVSGLKPDTAFVPQGAAFLNDGDSVRLATPGRAGGTAPAAATPGILSKSTPGGERGVR